MRTVELTVAQAGLVLHAAATDGVLTLQYVAGGFVEDMYNLAEVGVFRRMFQPVPHYRLTDVGLALAAELGAAHRHRVGGAMSESVYDRAVRDD